MSKVGRVRTYIKDIIPAFSSTNIMQRIFGMYQTIWVGWEALQQGMCKLNFDGSCKRGPNTAGGGGDIRDWRGKWVGDFSIKLGSCLEMEAEA